MGWQSRGGRNRARGGRDRYTGLAWLEIVLAWGGGGGRFAFVAAIEATMWAERLTRQKGRIANGRPTSVAEAGQVQDHHPGDPLLRGTELEAKRDAENGAVRRATPPIIAPTAYVTLQEVIISDSEVSSAARCRVSVNLIHGGPEASSWHLLILQNLQSCVRSAVRGPCTPATGYLSRGYGVPYPDVKEAWGDQWHRRFPRPMGVSSAMRL